jgi:hypothetical protein
VNKVGGQQPGGLSLQEGSPAGVCSPWWRPEAGSGQDPADRADAQAVSEPEQFALEAAVAPRRVLVCQAQDQVAEFVADWWAARLVGVGPFSGDQVAVPGQQRRRGDDAMPMQVAGGRRVRADRVARCGQLGRGWLTRRRSTVTSWRRMRISTSLAAALRASNLNQLNTTQEIRYGSRNSPVRDHDMIT